MKILLHWVVYAAVLLLTSYVVPGFRVSRFVSALLAAVVMGLLNISVFPLLLFLTFPITILTFGLFIFFINALLLKLGAALVPGFEIKGFLPALIASFFMTCLGWVFHFLMV